MRKLQKNTALALIAAFTSISILACSSAALPDVDSTESQPFTVSEETRPDTLQETRKDASALTSTESFPEINELSTETSTVETTAEIIMETVLETVMEQISETTMEMVPETTMEQIPETAIEQVPETATELVPESAMEAETVMETSEALTAPAENDQGTGGNSNFNTYNNQDQQNTEDTYVLNTSTKKIHYPNCSSVPKIAPHNYATSSDSLTELENHGYEKCKRCFK